MVVRVLLFIVVCAIVLAVVMPLTASLHGLVSEFASGAIAAAGAYVLTFLFARWDGVPISSVGARLDGSSILRMLFGLFVGLVLVGAWSVLSALTGHILWVRVHGATGHDTILALVAYLSLATREELAFRGYPLRTLERTFGSMAAQVVVASMFALEHRLGGASWSDALIGAGIGSLLFGAAALATRGLAVPIGLHAAWNFGQWSLSLKGHVGIWQPAGAQSNTEAAYRTAMLLYAAVMLSATIVFTLRYRYSQRRPSDLP